MLAFTAKVAIKYVSRREAGDGRCCEGGEEPGEHRARRKERKRLDKRDRGEADLAA